MDHHLLNYSDTQNLPDQIISTHKILSTKILKSDFWDDELFPIINADLKVPY